MTEMARMPHGSTPGREDAAAGVPETPAGDRPLGVGDALRVALRDHGGREALVGRHARYSFAELERAIEAAAAALCSFGVAPGDRIAATARNDADIVIAFHAVQRLGAIWVGVARQLSPDERAYQLGNSGARYYLADEQSARQVETVRHVLPELERVIGMEPGDPASEWRALLARFDGQPRERREIDPYAPAVIGYTSGTTGFPKGVVHSQYNMMVATAADDVSRIERQACVMQLTTMNVMMNHGLGCLRHGITLICVDRADAGGILEWVEREGIEGFRAPPPVIHDLLTKAEFAAAGLSGLRYLATAGAGASRRLRALYEQRFGRPMLDGYGLTEAPGAVTRFAPGDRPDENAIGRPLAQYELAILDMAGRELPAGEVGEICVRARSSGPLAGVYRPMLGYWRNPEASAAVLKGGWLHTGDLGHVREDGMVFLSARRTDMILRGGANVYPREIERVLEELPGVRTAIALGLPDDRLGEIVAAAVEHEAGIDAGLLRNLLVETATARLAKYKVPVVWLISEALPRNSMGKVDRRRLRQAVLAAASQT